jgi:uncharacterized protein YggE
MELKYALLAILVMAAAGISVNGSDAGYSNTSDAGIIGNDGEADLSVPHIYHCYTTARISTSASEKVEPDVASFVVYVKANDSSSRSEAAKKNAGIVRSIKGALAAAGLNESEMATSNYYIRDVRVSSYTSNGAYNGTVLFGYEAVHSFTVRTAGLETLGPLMDIALKNGASSTGELRYSLREDTALQAKKRLLRKALGNADEKIVYAFPDAVEVSLLAVNESSDLGYYRDYPGYTFGAAGYGYEISDGMTEVEVPDIEINTYVTAEYIVNGGRTACW